MNSQSHIDELIFDGRRAFVEDRLGDAIDAFSRVLDEEPENLAARTTRGSAYLRKGEIADAITDFTHVITVTPNNPRGHHLQGLALEKNGDDHRALDALNTALELDPGYGAAYMSRANLYAKMGKETEASEDMAMVTLLTQRNIEAAAGENNVWRSHHMQVEEMMETELQR
jgi:Flp pilus assembly protein TadD